MSIGAIFSHRVRGVRLVEVWAFGLLAALVFGVYMTKTFAGREATEIATTQDQIVQEQTHIRLLKAEVAYLEQPERIERLSHTYLPLQPMQGKRETPPERLADIAVKAPAPVMGPTVPMALAALTPVPAAAGPQEPPVVPVTAEPIDAVGERR